MALNLVRGPPRRLHRELQAAYAAGWQSQKQGSLRACTCCWQSLRHSNAKDPQRHRRELQTYCSNQRSYKRRSGICYAEADWSKVKVIETSVAASGLQRLVLDIGEGAKGHQKGGQFLQLKVGESKPGFYAIASPPDSNNEGVVELLVKKQGETAELLCSQSVGAEVQASPVQGKGFPVERVPPEQFPTLLIFATGSGISPIRSLIESDALQAKQRKDVRLYYGTFNPDRTAYKESFAQWEAAGIKVIMVYSDDELGYIQDAFEKDGLENPSQSCAVLVGQKEMCLAVTDMLTAKGVDRNHILLNF